MKKPINNKYVVGQTYYEIGSMENPDSVKSLIYQGMVAADCSTTRCEKLLHQFRPSEYADADSVPEELLIHIRVRDVLSGPLTSLELRKAIMSNRALDEKRMQLPVATESDVEYLLESKEITPSGLLTHRVLTSRDDLESQLYREDPISLFFDYEPTVDDLELVSQFSQNLGITFSYNTTPKWAEVLEPMSGKENLKLLQVHKIPSPESAFFEMLETFYGLQSLSLFYSRVSNQIGLCLNGLEDLHILDLTYTKITDWIKYDLASCSKMTWLTLDETRISDDFFRVDDLWPELTDLKLNATDITDQGVALIREIPQLEMLWLDGTHITDAAIPYFQQMENLKNLSVQKTAITVRGARELIESMEDCWVFC